MKMVRLSLRHLIASVLFFISISINAQSLTEKSSYPLPFEPTLVSKDRQGFLYIANNEGTIHKLNQQAVIQSTFSPQKRGEPKILETWQGLRVFVYYQTFQEYLLLNRFLSNENRVTTALEDEAPFTSLATLGNDNNLWLYNDRDLILTKREINNQEIIVETQLNLTTNFSNLEVYYLRAYQSYLFMATNNGILLFDNLGNYLDKFSDETVNYFSFIDDEIYYLTDEAIEFVSIEKKTKREIRLPELPRFVLMENNQVFAFKGRNLIVYDN